MSELEKLEELFRNGFVLEDEYHKRKEDLKNDGLLENDAKKQLQSINPQTPQDLGFDNNAIPQIAAVIRSFGNNNAAVLNQAVTALRKLLSLERNPPIQEVINEGLLPNLIQCMQQGDHSLKFEATWCITNVASGTNEHVAALVGASSNAAVPTLINLLQSSHPEIVGQAIWALGNIAGDSPKCRDFILNLNVAPVLIGVVAKLTQISILRNGVWAISNLMRGKPQPSFEFARPFLPLLAQLLHSTDHEVTVDTCWAFSYISDGAPEKERIQAIIELGVVKKLVELVGSASHDVSVPALRTCGNITFGDDLQTQIVLNSGLMAGLANSITSTKKGVQKETIWILSNITAGTKAQIQAVIDAGLFPKIQTHITKGEADIKKEAAWALANATTNASPEQIEYFAKIGSISLLCNLLSSGASTEKNFANFSLQGIENILKAGKLNSPDGKNPYADIIEAAGGIEYIEVLQTHPDQEVYAIALRILENFFAAEDVEM